MTRRSLGESRYRQIWCATERSVFVSIAFKANSCSTIRETCANGTDFVRAGASQL